MSETAALSPPPAPPAVREGGGARPPPRPPPPPPRPARRPGGGREPRLPHGIGGKQGAGPRGPGEPGRVPADRDNRRGLQRVELQAQVRPRAQARGHPREVVRRRRR